MSVGPFARLSGFDVNKYSNTERGRESIMQCGFDSCLHMHMNGNENKFIVATRFLKIQVCDITTEMFPPLQSINLCRKGRKHPTYVQ